MKYCLFIIVISITIILAIYYRNNLCQLFTNFPPKKWNGICLFDIDGTLTTGIDNTKSVDLCLKAGYAVGIITSGSLYTPENLMSFGWMPKNLYDFMYDHGFNTFNNVANNIIMGKYDPSTYQDIRNKFQGSHEMWGLLKGRSLVITASEYNISNPKKMILFDNDPIFLESLSKYNPYLVGICAGYPCGPVMKPQLIHNILS
jgi:hypothetical protein